MTSAGQSKTASAGLFFTLTKPGLEFVKRLHLGAAIVALIVPIGCSGSRGAGLPDNTKAVSPNSHQFTTHYARARVMPQPHLVENAQEYRYDLVGVTFGRQSHAFASPQSVTSDANGVTVIDAAGRSFSFPSGSTVQHGTGTYYVVPGAAKPAWLSHAKFVKTLTRADI
jgi:hypothetical protein